MLFRLWSRTINGETINFGGKVIRTTTFRMALALQVALLVSCEKCAQLTYVCLATPRNVVSAHSFSSQASS